MKIGQAKSLLLLLKQYGLESLPDDKKLYSSGEIDILSPPVFYAYDNKGLHYVFQPRNKEELRHALGVFRVRNIVVEDFPELADREISELVKGWITTNNNLVRDKQSGQVKPFTRELPPSFHEMPTTKKDDGPFRRMREKPHIQWQQLSRLADWREIVTNWGYHVPEDDYIEYEAFDWKTWKTDDPDSPVRIIMQASTSKYRFVRLNLALRNHVPQFNMAHKIKEHYVIARWKLRHNSSYGFRVFDTLDDAINELKHRPVKPKLTSEEKADLYDLSKIDKRLE